MASTVTQGFIFNTAEDSDHRTRYPSVHAALGTGGLTGGLVDGVFRTRLSMGQRFVGLTVYIIDEDATYRFVDGITNADFKKVTGGGGGLSETEVTQIVTDNIYDGFDNSSVEEAASANTVKVLYEMLVGISFDLEMYKALVDDLKDGGFLPLPTP